MSIEGINLTTSIVPKMRALARVTEAMKSCYCGEAMPEYSLIMPLYYTLLFGIKRRGTNGMTTGVMNVAW